MDAHIHPPSTCMEHLPLTVARINTKPRPFWTAAAARCPFDPLEGTFTARVPDHGYTVKPNPYANHWLSDRGNFKLFGLMYQLHLKKFEVFGARLLKRRVEAPTLTRQACLRLQGSPDEVSPIASLNHNTAET